jgi:non-heme chloroperoxidase
VAPKTADLLENATLKVYRRRPHGLTGAYEQEFNADLLAFAQR